MSGFIAYRVHADGRFGSGRFDTTRTGMPHSALGAIAASAPTSRDWK